MAGIRHATGRGPTAHVATGGAPPAVCDLCGAPTVEVRCKIVCRRCGFTRDCSDP